MSAASSSTGIRSVHAYLLLLPAFVLLIAFTHYTAVATLIDSFFSTPKGSRPAVWVGLENYQVMAGDPVFWKAATNNLWFALATIPASIVLALVMGQLVPGIDNAAHLGGLLAGALFALVLARRWRRGSPHPRALRAASAAVLMAAVTGVLTHLPEPSYRLGEELRARQAINQFLAQDRRITQQWETILGAREGQALTFDQLAGRIDDTVTTPYQQSFDQLANLHLDAAAPSAQTLEMLRAYAALRTDASQALAEGLRDRDPVKIRKALESARQAPVLARGASAAAPAQPAAASAPSGPIR